VSVFALLLISTKVCREWLSEGEALMPLRGLFLWAHFYGHNVPEQIRFGIQVFRLLKAEIHYQQKWQTSITPEMSTGEV